MSLNLFHDTVFLLITYIVYVWHTLFLCYDIIMYVDTLGVAIHLLLFLKTIYICRYFMYNLLFLSDSSYINGAIIKSSLLFKQ